VILKDLEVQFCIVLHFLLLTQLSMSYWLKKYVFNLIMKKELFLLLILLYWHYLLSHYLIIRISLTQGLSSMSVVFVSKKVIRRLSVLSWDGKINHNSNLKLKSLTTNHNLMFIDHLKITNHHSLMLQQ